MLSGFSWLFISFVLLSGGGMIGVPRAGLVLAGGGFTFETLPYWIDGPRGLLIEGTLWRRVRDGMRVARQRVARSARG